ncbi:MAG: prephenate dehydrogenase/arogenate dehydrogenase family protein [Tenericutes bacterium HGW-Tenericutes-2]|jgi:prephenate dehydrogenase|nr:MAG: prephenate dehydrogenase/arogenate dehydrogenase family protein [Tenericutes bacterium HGW-Tenericutes-2]
MKIFVVGLGLIGASYAEGLHQAGHHVYGYDLIEKNIEKGIHLGFIEKDNSLSKISVADLIILALYPKDNVEFIQKNKNLLTAGQILTDVSGTKSWMMDEIEKILPNGISYTSHHPMAGRESSGFESRNFHIFKNANFIIVKGKKSDKNDIGVLELVANNLKFGKITVTDAKTHDELIAFTSQLTHILAVTLIQSDHLKETKEATGDSFRDLTRIAKINEVMWTELFLENKDALVTKINEFMTELVYIKELILDDDKKRLMNYLKEAKEKRKSFDIS